MSSIIATERTATSTALKVPELLQVIVKNLHNDKNKTAVAHMSFVCKLFSEVALPVLWSCPTGLRPLLKLLPQHTWREAGNRMEILTALQAIDILRLLHYAQFVKEFTWNWEEDIHYAENTLPFFFSQLPGLLLENRVLFPSLRMMKWASPHHSSIMVSLLGPRVEKLSISGYSSPDLEVLRRIDQYCPVLKHLEIECSLLHSRNPLMVIPRSTCDFVQLCSFSSEICLPPDVLLALGTMPHLTDLTFWTTLQLVANTVISFTQDISYFPALRMLNFRMDSLSDHFLRLLEIIRSPTLEKVTIASINEPEEFLLRTYFDKLSRHTQLSELCVNTQSCLIDSDDTSVQEAYEITSATLQPLLRISSLRCIEFDVTRFKLDRNVTRTLVSAFPGLRTLDVHFDGLSVSPLADVLLPFAEGCHNLVDLTVRLDAQQILTFPDNLHSTSGVQHLKVWVSAAAVSPANVAAYLKAIFPTLRKFDWVSTSYENASAVAVTWKEVARILEGDD